MKSYSNKVEGTAALKFGVDTNNHAHIIDFEYAQKSQVINTCFLCKTRTSSRRIPFAKGSKFIVMHLLLLSKMNSALR